MLPPIPGFLIVAIGSMIASTVFIYYQTRSVSLALAAFFGWVAVTFLHFGILVNLFYKIEDEKTRCYYTNRKPTTNCSNCNNKHRD